MASFLTRGQGLHLPCWLTTVVDREATPIPSAERAEMVVYPTYWRRTRLTAACYAALAGLVAVADATVAKSDVATASGGD